MFTTPTEKYTKNIIIIHLEKKLGMNQTNNNILLVEGIHTKARNTFEKKGFKVQGFKSSLSQKEKNLSFSALGIRSRTQLDSHFFNQSPNLLTVGAFCIGGESN